MDSKNNSQDTPECSRFPVTIGKVTFLVRVHFSETSKETLEDKVMRMFKYDVMHMDDHS